MAMENIKVKHVMADGTVRDSIEGVMLPVNEDTEPVYRIFAEHRKRVLKQIEKSA